MGGRRSYSIDDFTRKSRGVSTKKANLTKALKNENVSGVTVGSIRLVSEQNDIVKIFKYSQKLLTKIVKKYTPEETKTVKDIVPKVRTDWAELKRKENFDSNRIIDEAVIYSVGKFLRERNE